ncbi:PDDEXK nuclease domain-containing protein [Anaerosporobacter sp.]|uniref:PDDEXK nuclease domain-containing protein n=1 Tax=Anaerosporobacter sp. TaxID=1872529 RepID=UPI00286ED6D3|nr:PDDEXK nuclease domain-containing protein [Anaerosporobacter sp.]
MGNEISKNTMDDFNEVISIIEQAQESVYRAANREFISMYWNIGRFVSEKVRVGGWGKSIVKEFSEFIQLRYVGIQGFSASNIWRMRQFYETYKDSERLAELVKEINWTNNLKIMARAKTDEAREFYLQLTAKNRYSTKELERQIDSMLFERTMISDEKNKLFISRTPGLSSLRDNYVLEFLDIPHNHKEHELRKAILVNLKDFILEFGKDFTFVGEEYRVQVGNTDFWIDLLFFNRELACLVAIELKVGSFKPEHLGQLEFYLEALDSDVKKENENPSVGLILCADKDDAVVEYALRRSISPALVADYQLHLPDKKLLENKLRELAEIAETNGNEEVEDE